MSYFPYAGLRSFERDEVDIFFGRDQQVYELLERLGQTHFLAVLGASGCGKSSLVRTGLLPSLDSGFLAKAGSNWQLAEMRPANQPFENLAKALLDALGRTYSGNFQDEKQALTFLQIALQRGSGSIGEILSESPLPEKTNLLLLVDQFEEIFRYRATEQATAFVWLLLETSRLPNVYITITMRSDFLSDCSHFVGLPEAINKGLYLTPRLSREQLQDAIELPAIVFNSHVEPALVNHLLNDVGNNPDQLPLLQHLLMRMWRMQQGKALTLAHYVQIGGLQSALSNHLEIIFSHLTPTQQQLTQILFCSLCERGDSQRDTRRPVKLAEVAALAEVEQSKIIQVINAFRREGRSFLLPAYPKSLQPDSMIDISHESLIRQWGRLKEWVSEETKSAVIYQRLEKNALLWKNKEHGLYRTPELENALVWHETTHPTPLWASRYGEHFELAMAFLQASYAEQQKKIADQQARVQAQQHYKLRQVRRFALLISFALLVMSLLAGWAWYERHNAQQQMAQIAQMEKQHITELFQAWLTQASLLAKNEDYPNAAIILEKTTPLEDKVAPHYLHARHLLKSFSQLQGAEAEQIYRGADYPLATLAVSPDGKLLATAGEHGTLVIFETQTGKLLQRLQGHHAEGNPRETTIRKILFTPDGTRLISAGNDKKLIIWQRKQNAFYQQTLTDFAQKVTALAISPDGKTVATGTTDNQVELWSLTDNQPLQLMRAVIKATDTLQTTASVVINDLAFNPTGDYLAGASADMAVIWEVATGAILHNLKGHSGTVLSVAFSPDSQMLAAGCDNKTIHLWQIASETPQTLIGHQKSILALHFLANGEQLISAGADRDIRIWDTRSGVTTRLLQGHNAAVVGLSSYAGQLFSTSTDGTVRRWSLALPFQQTLQLSDLAISTAIAPDLQYIAVGLQNGALQIYDNTGKLRWEVPHAHSDVITRLSFNPTGDLLASSSLDNTGKIWAFDAALPEKSPMTPQQTLVGHTDAVQNIVFSADGEKIATASFDSSIGLFSLHNKTPPVFIPNAHTGKVTSVSFSKTGQQLLSSGSDDHETKLWQLSPTPKLLKTFPKANDSLFWASLSPNSQYAVSVGREQAVDVYNVQSTLLKYHLEGHQQSIYKAIFSPDGMQLLTLGDTSIRAWNLNKGGELFTLRLPIADAAMQPVLDFDFRCTRERCLIATPLMNNQLLLNGLMYQTTAQANQDEQDRAEVVLWKNYLHLVSLLYAQNAFPAALQAQQETDALGDRLMRINPNNPDIQRTVFEVLVQKGQLQKSLHKLPQAIAIYNKATTLGEQLLNNAPQDLALQEAVFNAFSAGAATLSEASQAEQAMQFYQRLFKLPLDNSNLLIERIRLAETVNAQAIAQQDGQKILQQIDKKNPTELNNIGYALATLTHQYEAAYQLLTKALQLRPNNAVSLDSLGWLLHKMGKNQAGLNYLLQAKKQLANSSQDPAELAAHLSQVYWAMGNKTQAQATLNQALADFPDAPLLQEVAKMLENPSDF